jgi:hypothetical protein
MSNYRMIRIGLLVAVIVGGLIFHHKGHAYEVIRVIYVVIVLGFLVWRIGMRRGRSLRGRNRQNNSGGPPYQDPGPPPAA